MNNEWTQKLYQALRTQDWDSFRYIRYTFSQEGSIFYIKDLDLSDTQLGDIPSSFLCFYNCNLTNASFRGKKFFPVSLWKCDARNLDLHESYGMFFAFQSNLKGVQFDHSTNLFPPTTNLPSAFEQCELDTEFQAFIKGHGATLHFPPQKQIPLYAYGVPIDLTEKFLTGSLTADDLSHM